ncbi:phage regulatory CII family protein [Psychrobacter pygoscelis]|uniref:phage regulatory CII family protein n=1 Tax=Psychrobacter pygoscelis TaxID=2488563 RepID=UPI00103BBA71|nr:phage regulatory CII family protein [Psychrobacter pygoscelis]
MNVIDAAHKTVHNPKNGGSPALAARMDMSSTVLNSKVNPNCDTHHLRLDEALTIMEFTNDYKMIHAMAHQLGGVFCKVDAGATEGDLLMTVLSTGARQGEVVAEMHKALEDGRIDCSEYKALTDKIQRSLATLRALQLQLDDHCGGDK